MTVKLATDNIYGKLMAEEMMAPSCVPILRNRAKCLRCGDIIESRNRHEFVTCKCGALSVDGGHDYIRRVFSQGIEDKDYEELTEYGGAV